jgi:hypothetical protein
MLSFAIYKYVYMKTKNIFLWVSLMLFSIFLHAQTLSPTVISSSGGYFSSATGSLSTTVAEMTMVQTFTGTNNILTQGFQQPEDFSVSIIENEVLSGELVIFPNPTNGQFSLIFNSDGSQTNSVKIYNLVGQIVFAKTLECAKGTNTHTFDISHQSQGIYLLELTTTDNKGKKNISVEKINLIY